MNEKSEKDNEFNDAKVNREDGLNVSYDRDELNQFLPHLMDEIENKKKSIQIESIDYEVEGSEKNEKKKEGSESKLDDLSDPKAIHFIRRCSTKKEAKEILDYLLGRGEITPQEYETINRKLDKKEGLRTLIKESGGFKEPGYYIRKYYYNQKSEQNNK
ncbi:MAG: hypothetical protein BAJALOKI3v1_730006 [Promethearchaeota archaeon]|jgi:hypothetical protein|nr:MAG: hypothetical protein BAJALOKI3v1_730006 [Candidatus Lokiarchaeota archaeon]